MFLWHQVIVYNQPDAADFLFVILLHKCTQQTSFGEDPICLVPVSLKSVALRARVFSRFDSVSLSVLKLHDRTSSVQETPIYSDSM